MRVFPLHPVTDTSQSYLIILPSGPENDGMVECFNPTCLMMQSMFLNDLRDKWDIPLPFIMHVYTASIH